MTQSALFGTGTQLASFVTRSGLLRKSWDVIKAHHEGIIQTMGEGLLSWNIYKESDSGLTIIAFQYPSTNQATLASFNNTAISLLRQNYSELLKFVSQMTSSTGLIVTGLGFGGFVASLFTTLLLGSLPLRQHSLLCITFGSPLIGNKKLQQDLSNWNCCFFHVVSLEDTLPRLSLANHSSETSAYTPSGTFLFCSEVNSTCFQNPESVLEFLKAIGPIHVHNQELQYADYGKILENHYHKTIWKDLTTVPENMQNVDMNTLKKMEELEQKFIHHRRQKKIFSYEQLSSMKIRMAELESYKKYSRNQGEGYYDNYKDFAVGGKDVESIVKNLNSYWEEMVKEANIKPQKRGAAFLKSWLYGGTNFRRMVEPLIIAEYYRNGGKDYVTKRPNHFVLLEKWVRIDMNKVDTSNEEDSLNWNQHSILELYWDEDCNVNKDGHSDKDNYWHSTIDEFLASSKGSKVDEEEWNFEGKINSYIKSDDENVPEAVSLPMLSTTTSMNNVPIITDINLIRTGKRNVEDLLTSDSCFWARVEEARISCRAFNAWLVLEGIGFSRKDLFDVAMEEKKKTRQKLVTFEEYVYDLLKNYQVSPEIFLPESSYMLWWNEYKTIIINEGTSYDSKLASFMNDTGNYDKYALGDYDFL